MSNTYQEELTLDVSGRYMGQCIPAKQGDTHRQVLVILTDNGVPYAVAEGTTVEIRVKKPSGKVCDNPGTLNTDGTVLIPLSQQCLAEPGIALADIALRKDGGTLSTTSFAINVAEAGSNGNAIASDNQFLHLEAVTERAGEAADKLEDSMADIDFAVAQVTADKEVVATHKAAAQTARAAAEEAASQAVQTAASIPEDYTALGQKVDSLCIVPEAAGSVIHVEDSGSHPIPELTLYGKSSQNTTTGKNLFDLSGNPFLNYRHYLPGNGNQVTYSLYYGIEKYVPVEENTQYTYSQNTVADGLTVIFYDAEKQFISGAPYTSISDFVFRFTTPDQCKYIRLSILNQNSTWQNEKPTEVQLELGAAATDYEPYSGAQPSPNPDYPQEILSAADGGALTITSVGRNLLPYPYSETTKTVYNVTFTDNGDGSITLNGTSTGAGFYYFVKENKRFPAGNYTISAENSSNKAYVGVWSKAKNLVIADSNSRRNFALAEDSVNDLEIYIRVNDGYTFDNVVFKPMLTFESVAAGTYEPYRASAAALSNASHPETPIFPLRGLPVQSGGNVTIGGQQYLADTLTKFPDGTGEVVKRVKAVRLSSSGNWLKYTAANGISYFAVSSGSIGGIPDFAYISNNAVNYMCTHLNAVETSNYDDNGLFINLNGFIVIVKRDCEDVIALKQWLTENEVYLIYGCTQTTIPLTAAEVAELEKLYTFKPVTNIYNDAGAHMEVRYIADPKTYVDNKFAQLAAEITASQ